VWKQIEFDAEYLNDNDDDFLDKMRIS